MPNEIFNRNVYQQLVLQHVALAGTDTIRFCSNDATCTKIVGPYQRYLSLPAVPLMHPYHPNSEPQHRAFDSGVIRVPVVARLYAAESDPLAAELGVATVERFMVMQSNPWQNIPLLLRPHPWAHPNAPELHGNYNQVSQIEAWIGYKKGNLQPLGTNPISTHTAKNVETGENNMNVFSPNNMALALEHSNNAKSHMMYSVCIDRAQNRAAITLHFLLSQADTEALLYVCRRMEQMRPEERTLFNLLKMQGYPLSSTLSRITYFCSGITPPLTTAPEFVQFLAEHNKEEDRFDANKLDNPNAKNVVPLELALTECNPPVLTYLFKAGADINKVKPPILSQYPEIQDISRSVYILSNRP